VKHAAQPRPWSPPSSAFAGFRFAAEVIVVAVRWYLRYGLSYCDVEELLAERGIQVDHVTVYRWVRWVRTVRTQCLDWTLIWNRQHLQQVLTRYLEHHNTGRPHRGIGLQTPAPDIATTVTTPCLLPAASNALMSSAGSSTSTAARPDAPTDVARNWAWTLHLPTVLPLTGLALPGGKAAANGSRGAATSNPSSGTLHSIPVPSTPSSCGMITGRFSHRQTRPDRHCSQTSDESAQLLRGEPPCWKNYIRGASHYVVPTFPDRGTRGLSGMESGCASATQEVLPRVKEEAVKLVIATSRPVADVALPT
jgi:Integrase core domain